MSITSSDPVFMTPEIKSILRRKNSLMRRGRIEEVSSCAKRDGRAMAKANNRQRLRDIDPRARTGMAGLWRIAADIDGGRHKDRGQADDPTDPSYRLLVCSTA